jgi:hypothetical protein
VRARAMGKEGLAAVEGGGDVDGVRRRRCSRCRWSVRLQCVAALLLGAAVLLSAMFWLPPFAGRGRRAGPRDPPEDVLAGQLALPRSRPAPVF